jgi:thiol-disulfide isomerase/thioredoxin
MKVLKIGAIWCPGCLVMRPRWIEIEKELPWLETEYFEYDDHPEVMKKYSLDGAGERLPVFIFLGKDGKEITRLEGEIDEKTIIETVQKYKDK